MEKELTKIKEILKELINDENATKIAEIGSELDSVESEHKKLNDDYSGLKDSYIEIVKNTNLATKPKDDTIPEPMKDLDTIMQESLEKIVKKNKGE